MCVHICVCVCEHLSGGLPEHVSDATSRPDSFLEDSDETLHEIGASSLHCLLPVSAYLAPR